MHLSLGIIFAPLSWNMFYNSRSAKCIFTTEMLHGGLIQWGAVEIVF